MGLYKPTLNTSFAKRGVPVILDDNNVAVRRMVLSGHLVPADAAAREAQDTPLLAVARAESKADKVRQAMAAAREARKASEGSSESSEPTTPEAPEENSDASEGVNEISVSSSLQDVSEGYRTTVNEEPTAGEAFDNEVPVDGDKNSKAADESPKRGRRSTKDDD